MTGEEKINVHLNSLSREEKLNRIMDAIADWDINTLVETAQSHVMDSLRNLSDNDLGDEYYEWFSGEYENGDFEDDEEVALAREVCQCPITQLLSDVGHNADCPESIANV